MKKTTHLALAMVLGGALNLVPASAAGQNRTSGGSSDHWVATWATAQQLMPGGFNGGRGGARGVAQPGPPPAPGQQAQLATQQAGRGGGGTGAAANIPPTLEDQTIRMIVRTSVGGRRVRIEVSNMLNAQPLQIGAAHIALHKGAGQIVAGTDRVLTFSGNGSCTVPPGVLLLSDPVDLDIPAMSDLAVSLYLPRDTGAPTNHMLGLHTAYISRGDTSGAEAMPDPSTTFAYLWLSSVDVIAPSDAFTVVAFGDSITDGYATTRDADRAWPTLLAKRLSANKATQHVAVVNQGISGNQVLRDGAGVSALARFDRDVLSRPGVKWMIFLEGINDINIRGRMEGPDALTSEELIAGYRQIIERAHVHGIKVVGATLMAEQGVPTASERGEAIRQAVNRWVRTKGNFDAVVDFDEAVRDPSNPIRLKPEFDPGDHIHPNDPGNQVMADLFDLALFKP